MQTGSTGPVDGGQTYNTYCAVCHKLGLNAAQKYSSIPISGFSDLLPLHIDYRDIAAHIMYLDAEIISLVVLRNGCVRMRLYQCFRYVIRNRGLSRHFA